MSGIKIVIKFLLTKDGGYMPDDLSKRRPHDASRVNVHESWEVEYWCAKFGCTKVQLVSAVNAVGTSASAVAKYLKR